MLGLVASPPTANEFCGTVESDVANKFGSSDCYLRHWCLNYSAVVQTLSSCPPVSLMSLPHARLPLAGEGAAFAFPNQFFGFIFSTLEW